LERSRAVKKMEMKDGGREGEGWKEQVVKA
jgi:hypothetical protein